MIERGGYTGALTKVPMHRCPYQVPIPRAHTQVPIPRWLTEVWTVNIGSNHSRAIWMKTVLPLNSSCAALQDNLHPLGHRDSKAGPIRQIHNCLDESLAKAVLWPHYAGPSSILQSSCQDLWLCARHSTLWHDVAQSRLGCFTNEAIDGIPHPIYTFAGQNARRNFNQGSMYGSGLDSSTGFTGIACVFLNQRFKCCHRLRS